MAGESPVNSAKGKKRAPRLNTAEKLQGMDEEFIAVEDELVQLFMEEEMQAKLHKVASLHRQLTEWASEQSSKRQQYMMMIVTIPS